MMNLNIDCPHCEAKAGELCKDDGLVNGNKIKQLKKALRNINLSYKPFKHYIEENYHDKNNEL